MTTVVGRWAGSDSIVELLQRANGTYCMTTYFRDRDFDRDLTREAAGEWLDMIRRGGGILLGEHSLLGESMKIPERTAT